MAQGRGFLFRNIIKRKKRDWTYCQSLFLG
nr:MAG TPA: hypothetical protein [Caudoviricetes sp.]